MSKPNRAALAAAALLVGLCGLPTASHAQYVLTLQEVAGDVLATGVGSLNLSGLVLQYTDANNTYWAPSVAWAQLGQDQGQTDTYAGPMSGPANFGPGPSVYAEGSGPRAGIWAAQSNIFVSAAYTSGAPIVGASASFTGATFASLGITPGTYTWTWGSGPDAGWFEITTAISAVPEPSAASLGLMGLACLGFGASRRRRAMARPG